MCSPCLCSLSASAFIHPPISTFASLHLLLYPSLHFHPPISTPISTRFLLEIFLKFLVSALFVTRHHPCTCGWCTTHALVVDARTPWQMASNCAGTQCLTIEKCLSYVAVTLNNKFKMLTQREFPGYRSLFRMQHLSHYSTRLAEERRRWTILSFICVRFATLK